MPGARKKSTRPSKGKPVRPAAGKLEDTDYDLPARVAVCRRLGSAFRMLSEQCGNIANDLDQLAKTFETEPPETGSIE